MINSDYLNEAVKAEAHWQQYGLLEGISDPRLRAMTAVMMENQMLFNELSTDSGDVAQFKRISIPLVRRIFPQLIANKIVTVQPLLGPTGLVYYMRFRYSSNKGAVRGASNNGGYPGDDINSLQQLASGDVNLSPYYSSQIVQNEATSTDAGGDTLSVFSPLEHTPILPGTVTGTVIVGVTPVQNFVVSQTGTFTFSTIGSPSNTVTSATLNNGTGELTLTWSGAPGSHHVVLSYEYNMECNQDLPEVNLVIENEEIGVKSRKVKAAWSYEVQQDLRSQHNLDAEAELTNILAQEINLEIDREVLGDLRDNAGTVSAWDYNTALGDTIKERYESLFVKLVEVSAVIHRKTLRSEANWIVTSPEVAALFETATAGFAPIPSESFTSGIGVQYVGTVNKRWTVYKDPAFPQGQILMGYKGDSPMDAGYYYCPYIPLTQTPTVIDTEGFCPRKGLITRYGKKMLRDGAKFYSRLTIANLHI